MIWGYSLRYYCARHVLNIIRFYIKLHKLCGPGSSVGIATGYGLDGPGFKSWWGERFFAHVQTSPGTHPASCTMGTGSFPWVKRQGCGADHPPPSSAVVENELELHLYSSSRPLVACYWVNFTFYIRCSYSLVMDWLFSKRRKQNEVKSVYGAVRSESLCKTDYR
jgi:hypothetical protein